ncbi:hypothetical protein [Alteribacter populi]|uniref:hypothetical protein n=1 Tax=Alteribacter populi TaxID=2011011 RepID=UPI000BBAED11|nr:hypothetical protein [Alteribacter populi]
METLIKIKYTSNFSTKEFERRFLEQAKDIADFKDVSTINFIEDTSKVDIGYPNWSYGKIVVIYKENNTMHANLVVSILESMEYEEFNVISVSDLN